MNTTATTTTVLPGRTPSSRPHLDKKPGPVTAVVFIGLLAIGLLFTGYSLVNDVSEAGGVEAHRRDGQREDRQDHLTYAQGASAELVAMLTIGAADIYGLPVSTTHVLSSGVAGTMVANKSGLQMSTLRNLAMAWVLTLPVAMLLSGSLYWLFTRLF